MPSLLSHFQHDAPSPTSALTLPLVLLVSSILAYLGTPVKHSLFTSAVAWFSICTFCTLRTDVKSLFAVSLAKKIAWVAGTLWALAQVCERAVDGKGIWWAKALVPIVIYVITTTGIIQDETDHSVGTPASPQKERSDPTSGSNSFLLILTFAALTAVYSSVGSNATIALGLAYCTIAGLGFLLVRKALVEAQHPRENGGSVIYSANGFLAQPAKAIGEDMDVFLSVARDVAAAGAAVCAVSAITLETWSFGGLGYWGLLGQAMGERWIVGQGMLSLLYALAITLVHMVVNGTLLLMIRRKGAFLTSLVPISAAVISQLILGFSLGRLWFAALYAGSTFAFLSETNALSSGSRQKMKVTRLLMVVATISFVGLAINYLRQPFKIPTYAAPTPTDGFSYGPAGEPLAPLQLADKRSHPVDQLVRDAESSLMKTLNSQSQSLEAAVTEYKRRYGIPPPPHFDKWYELAKQKKVQLIDEYDTIYHSLLPFWALSPATIRARVREALGFGGNNLVGILIRDGKAVHVEGGQDWQQQATVGMMQQFLQYLPDMDLAFNIHDEPRVVVPHDELSRLVRLALTESMPKANANPTPRNAFSSRPKDLGNGKRIDEVKTTRFNVFAHQPTWIPSRLSCSPESPARPIDEFLAADNLTAYALGELGFVYNHTAFSDVCNSPSFATTHGFFDRPNAFNVIHELFPIFSQSKMSSFQDILYPSPWYWFGKVSYNEGKDMDWQTKINKLWWRGSTTGGFSRDGGWRRQHRQQIVRKLNALDQANILQNKNKDDAEAVPEWTAKEVPRQDFKDIMDVHFSHVGQCDPGDCDAQREFFDIVKPADQQDAWKYKYLLDVDGNAFSGRFYAFLKSHSLTFKMAVFREWHEEWIMPWAHYIPLSLRGDDGLEAVRYFAEEAEGKQQAVRMAETSRDWANKVLRNEDFEVWFFRLLLEYGRVVDDNRSNLGYSGS